MLPSETKNPVDELIAYAGDVDRAIALLEQRKQTQRRAGPRRNLADAPVLVRVEAATKTYKLGRQRVEAPLGLSALHCR